jgi:hypothetical protein
VNARLAAPSALLLVVLLAGCASSGSDAAPPRSADVAYRGSQVVARADGRTYYFNNAPEPICFAFDVPGDWRLGRQRAVLLRSDEQALVGVVFVHARDFAGLQGQAVITRLLESWTRDSQAEFGRPLTWTIAPFEAARPAVVWQADWVTVGGRRVKPLTKVATEFPDGSVAVVSVGAPDWEAIARHVLDVLTTTTRRDCYWRVIRKRFGDGRG